MFMINFVSALHTLA